MDIMREIQTRSACIFFVLVHIPLSRFSSMFCFLSALVSMLLNIKTKYWFYEQTNRFVCRFFPKDKEAFNFIKMPKTLKYKDEQKNTLETDAGSEIILSREEQQQQETAAYGTVISICLFFSLLLNYVYAVFLQEILVSFIYCVVTLL